MSLSVWMLGLMTLGCGDSETPPCADGFVKKQGRWCVFDEAVLGMTDGEPDPAGLPEGEGGVLATMVLAMVGALPLAARVA